MSILLAHCWPLVGHVFVTFTLQHPVKNAPEPVVPRQLQYFESSMNVCDIFIIVCVCVYIYTVARTNSCKYNGVARLWEVVRFDLLLPHN